MRLFSCRVRPLSWPVTVGALAVASFLQPLQAQAGAFGLYDHSATSEALSLAGAAAGAAGLGSMYFNPATVTQFQGIQASFNLSFIAPEVQHTDLTNSSPGYSGIVSGFGGSGKSGDYSIDALLPATFATYQINDRVWLGMSVTAPYGLAIKMDPNYVGRTYSNSGKVLSTEATPTIGYRFNDMLSVGAGVRLLQFKVRSTTAIPAASAPSQWQVLGLQGEGTGIGAALGLTLTPIKGTDIGIGYRSGINQKLEGDVFGAPLAALNQPIRLTMPLPQSLMVSLRQSLNERWSVMASSEWMNWGRIGSPAVIMQANGQPHPLSPTVPLNYIDNLMFALGAEYYYSPQWTLRAGLAYQTSTLKETTRGLSLADNNHGSISFGAGYKLSEAMRLDLAYARVVTAKTTIKIDANNINYNPVYAGLGLGDLNTKTRSNVDIVSLGLTYRFDTPATSAALPVRP